MSQHSKNGVKVISTEGTTWTNRRRARRLIERGLAFPDGENTVRMCEQDHRFNSASPTAHGPILPVVPVWMTSWLCTEASVLRFHGQP